MNAFIYIAATLAGLFLSWMGLVFAMTGGKQFAYLIGSLLTVAHIGAFAYVGYKAHQGKGRQAAVALVLPLFMVMGGVYAFELGRLAVLHMWPDKVVKWKEEVAISTGEVIVVDREMLYRPASSGATGRVPQQMTIRFRYPTNATETIEWRTLRYGKRTLSPPEKTTQHDIGPGKSGPNIKVDSPEYPLLLDVERDTKSIYLITRASGKGACDEYYRYRYDNGAWRDDMLPENFEPRPANLFLDAEKSPVPSYVDRTMIRQSGERKDIRFRQVGPDRCLCGYIGNPVKSGCMQTYNALKE